MFKNIVKKTQAPYLASRMNGKMRDYYRIIDDPVGEGAFAQVYKCIWIQGKSVDRETMMKATFK